MSRFGIELKTRNKPSKYSNWLEFSNVAYKEDPIGAKSIDRIMPLLKDVDNHDKLEAVMLSPNKYGLLLLNSEGGADFIRFVRVVNSTSSWVSKEQSSLNQQSWSN
jgi:hypothetical protein